MTEMKKHLRNLFSKGELEQESNMQKMHIANSGSKLDADVPEAFVPEGFLLVSYAAGMPEAETSASTREPMAHRLLQTGGVKAGIKEFGQITTCAKNAQVAAVCYQLNSNRENL